jgi:hypothetical protein
LDTISRNIWPLKVIGIFFREVPWLGKNERDTHNTNLTKKGKIPTRIAFLREI